MTSEKGKKKNPGGFDTNDGRAAEVLKAGRIVVQSLSKKSLFLFVESQTQKVNRCKTHNSFDIRCLAYCCF